MWFVPEEVVLDSESETVKMKTKGAKGSIHMITHHVFCSNSVIYQEAKRLA